MHKNKKIELSTIIGKGSKITGQLNIKGGIRIDGEIDGEIRTDGFITIGPSGYAKANIFAKECLISGKVVGNINVQNALELDKGAVIDGDVQSKILRIHAGATLNGKCSMDSTEQKKKV